MSQGSDVLVVGAGPVGLTVACELAMYGIALRVVDSGRKWTMHSKANVLWPRVLEILERTKITEGLLKVGQQISAVDFYYNRSLAKRIDLAELHDSCYPFALTLPQPATESVMEKRLHSLGKSVEWGTRLVALEQTESGITASLQRHDGEWETVEVPWLVGADGSSSTVRGLINCEFLGQDVPVTFMLADAVVTSGLRKDIGLYFFGDGGSVATAPIGGDSFRIALRIEGCTLDKITPGLLEDLLLRRAGLRCSVDRISYKGFFGAQVRQADSYKSGHVFLAGDAAHLVTPASGQGMNIGIQDAVNLGWRLAGVVLHRLHVAELDQYAIERRAAAERVQEATSTQTRVVDIEALGSVSALDSSVTAAAVVPLMGPREISQLDTVYSGVGQFQQAGARFPLGFRTGRSGWDLALGISGPTVLLWPGAEWRSDDWTRTITSLTGCLPSYVRVEDLAGLAPGHLSPFLSDTSIAVIVRPDGHVAHRCRPEKVVDTLRSASNWIIPDA